jgi:hypothetical protein
MLLAINEISGFQASPTQKTMSACKMLLHYAATCPLAIIRYHASGMALNTDTDTAYFVLPNARSRYASNYILSTTPPSPPEVPNPKPNGAILTVCKIIHNVMISAAEKLKPPVYIKIDKKSSLCTFLYKLWAILNSLRRSGPTTPP